MPSRSIEKFHVPKKELVFCIFIFLLLQVVEDTDEYIPILSDDHNIDGVSEPESKSSEDALSWSASATAIRSNVSYLPSYLLII